MSVKSHRHNLQKLMIGMYVMPKQTEIT